MSVSKRLSIVIMDHEKIHDINDVIVKYSDTLSQGSSHLIFDVEPVNNGDVANDLTFFTISGEDEKDMDNRFKELTEKLDQLDTDYSIRNMKTGEFSTTIASVGAIYIKFDNLKIIPKGTYKQIDELKNIKTEFGYTKGYKPPFRPLEGISLEDTEIKDEVIYLFSISSEEMPKLMEHLSEKIMEIDPDFIIESKIFK